VVSIGKEGLGEKIIKATVLELSRHELIKIKVGKSSPASKQETAELLLPQSESSLVQIIGNTILIYKKNPQLDKEKQIKLPLEFKTEHVRGNILGSNMKLTGMFPFHNSTGTFQGELCTIICFT